MSFFRSFVRWHGGRDSNRRLAPRAFAWLVRFDGLRQRLRLHATSLASANGRTADSYHAHRTLLLNGAQMLVRQLSIARAVTWASG